MNRSRIDVLEDITRIFSGTAIREIDFRDAWTARDDDKDESERCRDRVRERAPNNRIYLNRFRAFNIARPFHAHECSA